ncbi:ABC-F family ATP-binding cassette domain-containing protein [Streptomyces sp. NPDC093225]|uniref:ABC-F family ATP-binding cassette domain-containing protein n=1 Tax=Streptomyces sp. NPDC093225 TaxID=3366034 RepID=UPI003816B4A3
MRAVSKAHGGRIVLDGVTCSFAAGERTGIVGENGSGKTTLLRLLAGLDHPDRGDVTVTAPGGLGLLAQEEPLPGHLTVQDVVDRALADLRGMEARLGELERAVAGGDEHVLTEYGDLLTAFALRGGYDADARLERGLHGLGLARLARGRHVGGLSGGERVRLRLAALLAADPEVLLLDEPTNHLDDDALTWLEEHLRGRTGTTVAVSHDRVFLDRVATTLVEVDGDAHRVTRYGSGYAGYLAERAAERRRRVQAHADWSAETARLREVAATTARRVAPGRARKDGNKMAYDRAAGRVQQSLAGRVRNAEERLRRLLDAPVPAPPEPLRFTPVLPAPGGIPAGDRKAPLVAAEGVAVAGRLAPVGLALGAGDRLLVTGGNGAGKSTLLRVLAGELVPDEGRIVRRGRLGHLAQQPDVGPPGRTVREAFGAAGTERLLALGLFARDRLDVRIGDLSTGQRQRLALAQLVSEPADVLLLDEPTNHLSLALGEELEAALDTHPGAVVVVSHDRRLRERWRGAVLDLAPARAAAPASAAVSAPASALAPVLAPVLEGAP